MPTETETSAKPERRERFRKYMQKLNPTAPAQTVIDLGLAVQDLHASLYKTLAARADLDPDSQQLLVGGIGSGKTTELLLAEKWLKEKQSVCLYIDISSETDLSGLNSGALLAGFGNHLSREFRLLGFEDSLSKDNVSELKTTREELKHFAFGKTETRFVPDYESDFPEPEDYDEEIPARGRYVTEETPGKLQRPFPALRRDIREIRKTLEFFVKAYRAAGMDTVVIFDGLDRLLTPEKFWSVVHQDLAAVRGLGVAVLAVAPLSVLYGKGRSVTEYFDRVHHIPTVSVDPGKFTKLKTVLIQRGVGDLAQSSEIEKIVKASGGVLRDLIALARDAGETAYLDSSEEIKAAHVKSAAKQLGESYLRGLSATQLRVLRKLAKEGAIDVSSELGIELLVTRRVLEYSATDFRVHPALAPLIRIKENSG